MAMEQFKKWEDAEGRCEIPDSVCDMIQDCTACKYLQERGWKAALEWVLSTFNKNIELSDLYKTVDIIDVCNMVEKELDNDNK